MPLGRPAFRPDLEGLRGIAILLVVLFHAGVRGLSGGFVGVDVFFVLSGYFITGMLARELTTSGTVDLTNFYGGRALRLLPALLVVLLATLAAVMWLYAPIDRALVATNARAVALYSGNIEFARGSVDYFGSGENPLLHTWSLAVEEQFYLAWPLLFLLVPAIARSTVEGKDGDAVDKRRLLMWLGVAAVLSFVTSLYLTSASQPWAFFGMPTRIWEFALGGAVALLMNERQGEARESPVGSQLLQVLGLAAIGIAVVSYDRATPYPGVAALLPSIGALGLLVGGTLAPDSGVSRGLSNPALRWFGRMSYAWYLWHWPMIGLGAVLYPEIGVAGRLAWAGAALVLAWLTYLMIEQPSREGRLSRMPRSWIAPVALGASVGAAVVAHGASALANRRVAQSPQRTYAAARADRMDHACWARTIDDYSGPCEFGDRSSERTLVLLGDSHAEHWLGGLDRFGRERGWKIVAMVKGGCPVAEMPEVMRGRSARWYRECSRYREAMVQRILGMRPDGVILSSWDHYMPPDGKGSSWQVTPEAWRTGLRRTYSRLTSAGIRTLAIRGTPRTWFDVPACLSRREANLPFARSCEYDRGQSLSPVAIAAQNAAARGLPIRFVNMNDAICNTPLCAVTKGRIVMFTDDNHLTASFTRSLAPLLGDRIEQALR